jgi:aspartate/methionine/tyrosine aminotransferase
MEICNMTANRLKNVKEYYFSTKLREVSSLIAKGKPIINMGIGSPDLLPSIDVISSLVKSVSEPQAHQYQGYQGISELRKAIADFYQTHYNTVVCYENEILPLMGSKEGIMHISMAFLNPGDQVLIPNPGYPTYSSVANLLEAETVTYDLNEKNGWLPDLDYLSNLDLSRVKIMWVNYPNMPTGVEASGNFFDQLILFGKRNKILIVNDNPYSFILTKSPQSFMSRKGALEVGMELNSLSKSFNMAGWRVGMLIANSENIKSVLKVKSNMDSGMFYGIQIGAVKALSLNKKWFSDQNQIYIERRKIAWKIADKLNAVYDKDSVGLFVWAKISLRCKNSDILTDELLYEKNIFVTPGKIFGSNGERYIRISLCIDKSKLMEAFNRL